MDFEESSNLFEGVPALDDADLVRDEVSAADETAIFHEKWMLERMSKEELISYIEDLHSHYRNMEQDVSFLSWEFRDYQDNLTYFSRAARLAHKLNASDLDTIAEIATQEVPHYFRCGYAALFLYNFERMRFELFRSSAPATEEGMQIGRDNFLVRLLTSCSYPFIAEYVEGCGIVETDSGKTLLSEVPESWVATLGDRALIFPLRVKQSDSLEPLTLGGLIIGNARRGLEAKDAEISVIFADLISSSLYNAQLLQKLNDLTIIDPLTQIYNRRHLINQLGNAMIQAYRQGHPLSVAMIDIDHFKRFNDQYGHICGDEVLREVAATLKSGIRAGVDVPARYGGEEFVLVMPFTDLDTAVEVANRIRQSVKRSKVVFEGRELSVTCSFGVAEYVTGESLERFVDRADASLYQAKTNGRDRVCAAAASRSG